jgi:hypothetical protein
VNRNRAGPRGYPYENDQERETVHCVVQSLDAQCCWQYHQILSLPRGLYACQCRILVRVMENESIANGKSDAWMVELAEIEIAQDGRLDVSCVMLHFAAMVKLLN